MGRTVSFVNESDACGGYGAYGAYGDRWPAGR